MQTKLFHRDFLLVVIGQIISLFGNAILRYAMPLYLLDQTGSAALYGAVSACAFLPMILLSPVGGILADRLPKAKMMVALDAITCAVVGTVALLLDRAPLVPLLLTGALYRKLSVQKAHLLLLGCSLLMIPMGVCRLTGASPMAAYLIFTLASMGLMALATLFSVVMLTYVQTQTPSHIVGKVVSCVLALSMCAQPVGQAMYGVLFEHLPAGPVILFAAGTSCLIALASRLVFRRL